MGYYYDEENQPTEAMREYWRLNSEKRDLQEELSLIQLRREVKQLRLQVQPSDIHDV